MPRSRKVAPPQPFHSVAYKGYLISRRTDDRVSISKDGFHIGSESDVDSAKRTIDFLTSEGNPVPKRARFSARGRRATSRKPNRAPRGTALHAGGFEAVVRVVKSGGWAEKIWYEDANDRKHYYHDFESVPGATMYLCDSQAFGKCVLIASGDVDIPLWENA